MIWRIRGRASFMELRRYGTKARAGAIGVAFLPLEDDEPPRVGYAISRRVGSAVVRNRLRRRLQAAVVNLARSDTGTLRGGLYLFAADPVAARLSFGELGDSLARACENVHRRSYEAGVHQ